MSDNQIATNRKARHEYHVVDSFEAGIALVGTEVKSLRDKQIALKDSFIDIQYGEMYLRNAHIAPYAHGNNFNHEPERARKLLMHKHEIMKLAGQVSEKGMTLIPLKLYFTRGKAKVQVGLCKGKDHADKRHSLKAKEANRDMDRAIRDAQKG